jgi:pyridoxine 5'-phosphate synthase PdxJ
MDTKELTELLNKYPDIKKRVEEMLLFVDGANEEVNLADEAEERVIEGVRGIGFSMMENWAKRQVNKSSEHIKKTLPKAQKHSKKKSAGKPRLEE